MTERGWLVLTCGGGNGMEGEDDDEGVYQPADQQHAYDYDFIELRISRPAYES